MVAGKPNCEEGFYEKIRFGGSVFCILHLFDFLWGKRKRRKWLECMAGHSVGLRREEYKRAIDEARPLPTRILPILTIIMEEAEDYLDGSKSAEQVSHVVNNRVQLYLDENR